MRVPGWDHRLPAVPSPFHLETMDSYIDRLARRNSIDPASLHDAARRAPEAGLSRGKSDGWKPLNVALWTGLPLDYFQANASMAYGGGGALRRSEGRYACSHCTHGEPVVQHPHHLYNACIKHRRCCATATTLSEPSTPRLSEQRFGTNGSFAMPSGINPSPTASSAASKTTCSAGCVALATERTSGNGFPSPRTGPGLPPGR